PAFFVVFFGAGCLALAIADDLEADALGITVLPLAGPAAFGDAGAGPVKAQEYRHARMRAQTGRSLRRRGPDCTLEPPTRLGRGQPVHSEALHARRRPADERDRAARDSERSCEDRRGLLVGPAADGWRLDPDPDRGAVAADEPRPARPRLHVGVDDHAVPARLDHVVQGLVRRIQGS